jgi:SAM-dependent methyltransferase
VQLTGERTLPGVPEENYWYRRHEATYKCLRPYCAGATVLEAGCGEGYGAALLASTAARVVALDAEPEVAAHVAGSYDEVATLAGDLHRLPLRSSSVDVVCCLQVIEHSPDQVELLHELARVCRPGGHLLVSTPNRLTFSNGRDKPLNPFHTRELSPAELVRLLGEAGFEVAELSGLRHGPGLCALDERYGGSIVAAQLNVVAGYLPGAAVWPPELLADVAGVRAENFAISGDDLDSGLDVIAVAVSP